MVKVAVCICTCQRPDGLSRLLTALAEIDWEHSLTVVVVDNDWRQEGRAVCDALPRDYRWKVQHAFESRRGISYARNRAVALALDTDPDCIAMLDDDEWPSRRWLDELMRVMVEHGADLVGGPVLPVFPGRKAAWVEAAIDCYGYDQKLPDGRVCRLHASGNFIGRRHCFEALMPEVFRSEFAQSGGEDFDFFRRLDRAGYRMHWAANATVHEQVPESRLCVEWLRHRMLIKGNIQVRMFRLHAPGPLAELGRWAKTVALFTVGAGRWLLGVAHPPSRMRGRLTLWRALGKVQGHLGRTVTRSLRIEGR